MPLQAEDIRGAFAIIATPAKPGADRWDATDTVDLDETARLVESLIADGVDGVLALGTTGECATLTEQEWRDFVDCVITTAAGRVPTFLGATALGTHTIVDRLRFVRAQGGTGSLLGLPMWQPCTEPMAVEFYREINEAVPELSIMIYMNERAFRFPFGTDFWRQVVEVAPNVTSAKYGRGAPIDELAAATGGRVRFLPIDAATLPLAKQFPEVVQACWSTASSMGPNPTIALMRAVLAGDWAAAEAISADLDWANETFQPPDPAEFAFYNIQLEKIRFGASGYCDPGPIRPPYQIVPDEYRERAELAGQRWAELHKKYAA